MTIMVLKSCFLSQNTNSMKYTNKQLAIVNDEILNYKTSI